MNSNQQLQSAIDQLIRSARAVVEEAKEKRRTQYIGASVAVSNLESSFNGYDKELKKYELAQATQAVTRQKMVEPAEETDESRIIPATKQFGETLPARPGAQTAEEKVESDAKTGSDLLQNRPPEVSGGTPNL